MKEIKILYRIDDTTKTSIYQAEAIRAQLRGPASNIGSIVNFEGNPDGIEAVLIRHAELFEIKEIKDYSGENKNAKSATYESTRQEPSSIKA